MVFGMENTVMAGSLDFIKNATIGGVAGINNAIEQGATFTRVLNYTDSNDATVDLSTFSARMKIRKTHDSATVLASWTSATEITLAATNPNITISVTAAATASLDWSGLAVYDFEIDDGGGTPVVTRLFEGDIELSKEVTR
jgi:hypothetical protein